MFARNGWYKLCPAVRFIIGFTTSGLADSNPKPPLTPEGVTVFTRIYHTYRYSNPQNASKNWTSENIGGAHHRTNILVGV